MVKNTEVLHQKALELLAARNVQLKDIAELVMFLQEKYVENLSLDTCIENVAQVLTKREVQNAVITGIELDILAEKGLLDQPLQDILMEDEGLYGVDEVMALSIVNVYGSIGLTNFGYIDKVKPGILKELNTKRPGVCNTYLDDIVGAIAAAAASRIAHADPDKSEIVK